MRLKLAVGVVRDKKSVDFWWHSSRIYELQISPFPLRPWLDEARKLHCIIVHTLSFDVISCLAGNLAIEILTRHCGKTLPSCHVFTAWIYIPSFIETFNSWIPKYSDNTRALIWQAIYPCSRQFFFLLFSLKLPISGRRRTNQIYSNRYFMRSVCLQSTGGFEICGNRSWHLFGYYLLDPLKHGTRWHNMAQHGTTWHNTAQNGTP